MRRIILSVALSLGGCTADDVQSMQGNSIEDSWQVAELRSSNQKPFEIDERCEAIGRYARVIAVMRDRGFTQDAVFRIDSSATYDETFPVKDIQIDIYNRPTLSPSEIKNRERNLCLESGYEHFRARLKIEEQIRLHQ